MLSEEPIVEPLERKPDWTSVAAPNRWRMMLILRGDQPLMIPNFIKIEPEPDFRAHNGSPDSSLFAHENYVFRATAFEIAGGGSTAAYPFVCI